MAQPQPKPWTVDEFLLWEAGQPERYEYVDAIVRMMTGGSNRHALVKGNLYAALRTALRAAGRGCDAWVDGPKVVTATAVTYPDVLVTCGPVDLDRDGIDDPVVVAEVLSRSSADYDRGGKWVAYQSIPALRHYLLVSLDERRVDLFTRAGDGWSYRTCGADGGPIALPALGILLAPADLYEGVPL